MAIDEAIAAEFAAGHVPPTLRVYSWLCPSFSIGRFQRLSPSLNDTLEAYGIPMVRRPTGGSGVFHDRDLSFALVASRDDPRFIGGLKATFRVMAEGWVTGLTQLGVQAGIHMPSNPQTGRSRSPFCFDIVGDEVVVQGKKLIGSAARRWHTHFLHQGSLTLERSPLYQRLVTEIGYPEGVTLRDWLPGFQEEQVAADLVLGMKTHFGVIFEEGALTDRERALSDQALMPERLTEQKSPVYNMASEVVTSGAQARRTQHRARSLLVRR